MKEMRPVPMDADAVRIKFVVGVPADVRSAIDDEDAPAELRCNAFGDDRARETGANDKPVEAAHARAFVARRPAPLTATRAS